MNPIDAAIVVGSLLALVGLGAWLASRQKGTADYYLGGRRLPAWALGISLAANQASAVSLIGAPAFVALRAGGGLVWLQYELAVPLAMAVLVAWGVPVLRRAGGADIYGAVEATLGRPARRAVAWLFLIGRGGGVGVIVYASALVITAVTGWPLLVSLTVVGGVAVIYTTLGGLVADVVSDVAQFVMLWVGTVVASAVVAARLWRDGASLTGVDPERLATLDLVHHGLGDSATFALWPMLLGGLFLYLAYYGCDQTQAQRILAARSESEARTALTVAAFARFPLVCTYCLFGILLAGLLVAEPAFAARLAGRSPDALVPEFLVYAVPVGLRGVAVAGILAAALSSIDSALNSLSAVTIEELAPHGSQLTLLSARLLTAGWGAAAVAAGWAFSRAGETTIELVNRVGSAVYGPTLGVFALAWRSRRADGRAAAIGAVAGVGAVLVTAWVTPSVSWLWWNPLGFGTTWLVGTMAGRSSRDVSAAPVVEGERRRQVRVLLALFAVIAVALALVDLLV